MKKLMASFAATAILSGCGSPTIMHNVEPLQGGNVTYEIQAAALGENPNERILDAYLTAVRGSTAYNAGVTRSDQISSGVGITRAGNRIKVAYLHENDRGTLKNNFVGDFVVDIVRKGDTYSVKVDCPSSMDNDTSMQPGMVGVMAWTPFIPKERVVADVNAMCTGALMHFPVSESGEITTEFKDSAVLANFARKFEAYNAQSHETDLIKGKAFLFRENNNLYKVAFSVYPYRNGSKVVYREEHAISCVPFRPCTGFDPTFAARLREKIVAVAND